MITSTSSIRKKIGNNVKVQEVFSKEKIKECDAIIEKAHKNFFEDILEIWQSIVTKFSELSENSGSGSEIIGKIAEESFILKNRMDAVGYGLGMQIAKSLHEFAALDSTPEKHTIIYGKHIDAMNSIIKGNIKGDGGKVGEEILKALGLLINKCSKL